MNVSYGSGGFDAFSGGANASGSNLLIESVQDVATSSSKTEGYNISGSMGADAKVSPGSVGANQNNSKSDSQWVSNQTTLVGGSSGTGEVNISADKTTVRGAVVASATRNEDGTLTDNGTLNLTTDELIVEDIQDKNHSESEGFNVSTSGYSGTGSTTVGLTSNGHETEQTTFATLGGGNITKKDGSAHNTDGINRDLNNSQQVTKDQQTAGLDATVTVDHRLASEEGREDIKNNFVDTYEHGEDIAKTVDTISQDENLGILNFGEALDNNAKGTQLKNDLLRNPENQHIIDGINSGDPELYAQAMKDLGHLAQEKFGLELSDINLYDGNKTDSLSLADTALVNVKGGTVVDESNQEYGNIFIDAGDGASKTDLANTLGHEVLETQNLQGKDSGLTNGLLGSNSADTQEALANAFGNQFADRINQAAGGDLDNSGGANFASNLQSSQAVIAGTQRSDSVGTAKVEHRQYKHIESRMLDQARNTIKNDPTLSVSEKKDKIEQLEAVACASVQCAAGVPSSDSKHTDLTATEQLGKQLIQDGSDIYTMLHELGVDTPTSNNGRMQRKTETSFGYNGKDALTDAVSSSASQTIDAVNNGVETAITGVAAVTVGPVVDAVNAIAGNEHDSSFTGYMLGQTAEQAGEVAQFESKVGEAVENSKSEATWQDENYLLEGVEAALNVAGGAKLLKDGAVAGAGLLKPGADDAARATDDVARVAGDVDGEMINLNQPPTIDDIAMIPKGERPEPSTYMSQTDIAEHGQLFEGGASRFMTSGNLEKYGPGQRDGTSFTMPYAEADKLESGFTSSRDMESKLGLPEGTLNDESLVRVDFPEPKQGNIRVPSGNEAGANDQWMPGGKLPGGNTEGVLDVTSETQYISRPVKNQNPESVKVEKNNIRSDVSAPSSVGSTNSGDITGAGNIPDFVVSPNGTAFPVPNGASGPSPVTNPAGNQTGVAFTGGAGGVNGQVATMRIMNPTPSRGSSPGYPNGYIKYENSALPKPQGVDPYTGKTLPNSQSHFSID